jgi:serine phosphatase RsbU (regulator of sigma subunit)
MRCAISWLTSPASVSPRRASLNGPPAGPAAMGGDIVCSARSASAVRLLVGDVMGHDPRAASTSAEVGRAFRDLAGRPGPVQDIAAGLHHFLTARPCSMSEEYVTALIISVPEDADGEAQMVNCGHPGPLLLRGPRCPRGPRESATLLDAIPSAPPLGLLDLADGPACPAPLRLGPGDSLLLYTDGVTEARDRQGRPYPLAERAAALAGTADGLALLQGIQADLLRHAGGTLADDATMLLVTVDGEPSPPLTSPVPLARGAREAPLRDAGGSPARLSEPADCQGSFLG